jgi:mitochondrial import receptor subunit TOM40
MDRGADQQPIRRRFQRSFRSFFPALPVARPSHIRCEEQPAAPLTEPTAATSDALPGEAAPAVKADDNAVQFEMFNKEWQSISQQDNWDGFRIEAANQVTKFLQATHTLFLGTQLRPEQYIYQFGPAFQSEDNRTMLVARAGLDGAVNGRAIQKVGKCIELKASSNSHLAEVQRNMHECSAEYTGSKLSAAAKLAWQGAWLFGGAFTQKILPSLQMGGDLTLVMVHGVTSIGQVGLRYNPDGRDIFTAAVSRTPDPKTPGANSHEYRLQYVRKVTERLALGTEYKYSHPDMESALQMGYEYTFRQARVQGLVDTDGKVSCCVSDFVGFGFSGMIDYMRGDYKFGVVMHVLPQPDQQPPP